MRYGSLMKLLYADDLVLSGESFNEVRGTYGRWKIAVAGKGLRVNAHKTMGMQLLFGKKISVSEVNPCSFCGKRVGCNFKCTECRG